MTSNKSANDFGWVKLRKKYIKAHKAGSLSDITLKIHRALSWLRQAEITEDIDSSFIFLWIAFNAAYADIDTYESSRNEKLIFESYLEKIASLDQNNTIHSMIRNQFSQVIIELVGNKYIFEGFWKYHRSGQGNWEVEFEEDKVKLNDALNDTSNVDNINTKTILPLLFGRLYTQRNQLVHGSATWESKMNRDQIRNGRKILGVLIPVFIEIMMKRPRDNWGKPFYPVVP